MGFRSDQEGIMDRYLDEGGSWDPHLENTRTFIRESFRESSAGSIAILGSGWLLDLPLENLQKRFNTIYLVDIHHPAQVRKKVGHLEGIELVEEDLSGGALEQVWKWVHGKSQARPEKLIEQLKFSPPLTALKPDIMVSLNLLNQLDILLCDFLQKHRPFRGADLQELRRHIQDAHLAWITQKPGCLVSDIREEITDQNGSREYKNLLYSTLPEGLRNESWWWDFDTLGNYHQNRHTRLEVKALEWC